MGRADVMAAAYLQARRHTHTPAEGDVSRGTSHVSESSERGAKDVHTCTQGHGRPKITRARPAITSVKRPIRTSSASSILTVSLRSPLPLIPLDSFPDDIMSAGPRPAAGGLGGHKGAAVVQEVRPPSSCHSRTRSKALVMGIALLAFLALSHLGIARSTPTVRHNDGVDAFGGKTLSPSNVTVVRGIFKQDDPSFNETGYDSLKDSFGLVDQSEGRWKNFTEWVGPDPADRRYITKLNREADEHTTYKVIYIARHGQGYHNVAESLYGTPAWNCYWSLLGTDGNITWGPDPLLTPLGEEQATANNVAWKEQIKAGVPLPQILYSSPMRRSASTLQITWKDILLNKGFKPIIKESYREVIGLHTCDERSNKTVLAETYRELGVYNLTPAGWDFEPAFNEHDLLWDAVYQETAPQQTLRLRLILNELFATDPRTFISITAHSGVIAAFFRAIGHRTFSVQTGGMVPVVVCS